MYKWKCKKRRMDSSQLNKKYKTNWWIIFSLLIRWQIYSTLSSKVLISKFQFSSIPSVSLFLFLKVDCQASLLILAYILLLTIMSHISVSALSMFTSINLDKACKLIRLLYFSFTLKLCFINYLIRSRMCDLQFSVSSLNGS